MDKILFAGPWIKPEGFLKHRVVLHAYMTEKNEPLQFVVHNQVDDKGKLGYDHGNYYMAHNEKAFDQAMEKFWERCKCRYIQQQDVVY